MKEVARKELEDWYKHHKEAIEKTRLANRSVQFTTSCFSRFSLYVEKVFFFLLIITIYKNALLKII